MNDRSPSATGKIPRLWPFKDVFYGWGIVATSVLVTFAQVPMYGPVLSVFVKPIGDDMGWSRGEISVAFTVGSIFGMGLSAIVGRQIDRAGARLAVTISGLTITGALVGLALMQEVWQFWIFFGVGRTVALAGIGLATSTAVAKWFVRKRGRAVSFLGIGLRTGQAIFPLFIAPVIVLLSWRHAYAMLAVIALVLIALPAWLFIRRRPEDLGLLPDGDAPESGIDGVGAARTPGSARAAQEVSWTLAEAKRTRAFWLIVVAVTAVVFAQTAVNLHAVASFQDRGVANASAGVFVFIFAGTAALSAYAWGALMDRIQVRWGTLLATLFMAGAMVSIIFADNLLLALLFAVLYGLGSGGWTVGQTLLFANYFGRGNLGAIRGLGLTISGPLSAMGPLLAGYIQTYFGDYRIAFVIFLAALGVVVLALLLAAPPKRPLATPS